MVVTVNPLPTATITGNATICQNGASPNIIFTGANGTAPYTFTYNINSGGNLTVVSTGNIATIAAPTNTAGVFTYTLVSVQDASGTLCSNLQGGIAKVTVDPTAVGGSVSGGATVCYGTNSGTVSLSGNNGIVVRWESSTDGGASWIAVANTGTTLTYNNLTATTQYRAVIQSGICATSNSSAATITMTPVSVGGSVGSSAIVCAGSNNATLRLTGAYRNCGKMGIFC